MKYDLANWLNSPLLNAFSTITLKQGILLKEPYQHWAHITPELVVKTATHLRDRVTKALVGTSSFRKGYRPPFIVFHHYDDNVRHHLHIVHHKPEELFFGDFETLLSRQAHKLEWVHERLHSVPIDYSDGKTAFNCLTYGMKNTTDGFLPEASFIDNGNVRKEKH